MTAKRFKNHLRLSRLTLFTLMLPLAASGWSLMGAVDGGLRLLYIVLGFSLIIFLHELGHFAVARMCSVKCLAFSIGIGPRLCGWRKHGGFSFGADPWDPETEKGAKRAAAHAQKHPVSGVQSDLPTTAHEPKHPRDVGDCDYRLSWAPLGGYVRMLGQDDMDPAKQSSDPHSFGRRPIWQRMCIVSAGVTMNLIFAAVCFSIIFSPGIGVDFPPAKIGQVVYDTPAWKAGLRPGDTITSIDGEQPRGFLEFADVQMAAALSDGKTPIKLHVVHRDGRPAEDIPVTPVANPDNGLLAFGLAAMPGLKIHGDASEYTDELYNQEWRNRVNFLKNKPEFAKLDQPGYRIIRVQAGATDVDLRDPKGTLDKYVDLNQVINDQNGQPVTLTVESTKTPGITKTLTLYPYIEFLAGVEEYPAVFGLVPQVVVSVVDPKYPAAHSGLQAGDRILRAGDRNNPDIKEFQRVVHDSKGYPVTVAVERPAPAATSTASASAPSAPETTLAAHPTNPSIAPITPRKDKTGEYRIGIAMNPDLQSTRFVHSSTAAEPADVTLPPTASIAALDGKPVENWQDIYAYLRTKNAGDDIKVTFAAGADTSERTYKLSDAESKAVREQLHYQLGISLENETKTQVAANSGQAVMMGLDHTKKFILNVYMTLRGLSRGTVAASNLHGIVGITKIGYDVQERGTVWLWYVLAMVSVNLAVANFLPLPIVDGGLFLLLILEKIRGKPLSMKVQTAIQTVGVVLLAGLFIFVTYNDITGLFLK
ncbi:MAG TPA: site-2 protease family protein [Phycisphaerae bacterium]|jgi:regulator of sigma E protease|nr:site-2 protease family protein [Phycisphaerae bacterium]